MKHLQTFHFSRNPMGQDGCKHLAKAFSNMTKLRVLNFISTGINAMGCKYLSTALDKNIKELYLSSNEIDGDGCKHICDAIIRTQARLSSLNLNDNDIGTKGCLALSSILQHVEYLNIYGSIGEDGFRILALQLLNRSPTVDIKIVVDHSSIKQEYIDSINWLMKEYKSRFKGL